MKPTAMFLLAIAARCSTAPAMRMETTPACIVSELIPTLDLVHAQATECTEKTGLAIIPPTTLPTDEQAAVVCDQCADLVAKLGIEEVPDCAIRGGVSLKAFFDSIVSTCSAGGNGSEPSAGSGEGNATNPAPTSEPSLETKLEDDKQTNNDIKSKDKSGTSERKTNEEKDDNKEKENNESASSMAALSMTAGAFALVISMAFHGITLQS